MLKIPEGVREDFSRRLRQAIAQSDWANASQKELAEELDVTAAQVSHYLHGGRLPSLPVAQHLCTLTGVSFEWLLTGKAPKRQKDLLQAWHQASDAERSEFLANLAKVSITK